MSKEITRRPKRFNDSMLQNDSLENVSDVQSDRLNDEMSMTVNELTVSESFFAETINGHKFSDLIREDSNLTLKHLTIDCLIVNDMKIYEAIEKRLFESDERMKRDASNQSTPIDHKSEPLIFNNVIVEGLVNGVDLNFIVKNALRTNVKNQRLLGEFKFGRLKAKSLQTFDGKLSNVSLSTIARTNVDQTYIKSPIRFTQTLQIDNLQILNRLNEILIIDGKLNALFKRSRNPQVITGQKEFESIVLLEPITLRGKINISNSVLNKIKPIVTVDEDILIENAAVSFVGNVTIKNILSAGNIFGQSIRYSVGQVLEDGLRLDEPVDFPIEFIQPIQIGDLESPSRINGIPLESLIRRNVSDVQKITATKIFTSDLSIEHGNCDANEINGINLQILNNTMLKRSGKNQIVTGTIQFSKIIAGR